MSLLAAEPQGDRNLAYQPETDAQTIRLILTELMASRERVRLAPTRAGARPLEDLQLQVSKQGLRLTQADNAWPAVAELADATLTAEVRGIRLRFEAVAPQLQTLEGRTVLALDWPQRLLRLQERDAFRVRPAEQPGPQCVLRTAPGEERAHAVFDVSALGVSLHWPGCLPGPRLDELWRHCRLEIPGRPPIPCDLRVRAVNRLTGEGNDGLKVGCAFHHPTPETQRAAQRYVLETERAALSARRQPARA